MLPLFWNADLDQTQGLRLIFWAGKKKFYDSSHIPQHRIKSNFENTSSPVHPHLARMPSDGSAEAEGSSAEVSNDLAALRAEQATLHQALRSYERDFFRQHNRQVSSLLT
jgi:hypothetical protein